MSTVDSSAAAAAAVEAQLDLVRPEQRSFVDQARLDEPVLVTVWDPDLSKQVRAWRVIRDGFEPPNAYFVVLVEDTREFGLEMVEREGPGLLMWRAQDLGDAVWNM